MLLFLNLASSSGFACNCAKLNFCAFFFHLLHQAVERYLQAKDQNSAVSKMKNTQKYNYHLRPGFGSEELLIEFLGEVLTVEFEKNLFDAIKEIKPQITSIKDLWMNDEILYEINSDFGQFVFTKDIWGFAFLTSENNQTCILKLDELLIKNERFQKKEVDIQKYKL